jgi:hypothetical protein
LILQLKAVISFSYLLLKRFKTILQKLLLCIIALQILNLSVDLDYIVTNNAGPAYLNNFDDIDSFTEYIVEKVIGDDHYTSENDDDDQGGAQNKGIEKSDSGPLFFETENRASQVSGSKYAMSWLAGLDQANKTCKGYFHIVSPPPEA